ncbi:endonuclease Q family protein [Patescibacteria group bacterium]|nr:endonuclease Q family protein [Patescibacteria group bacterium]
MQKIIDFHIHSKYARATSKTFDLEEMVKWSEIKGVDIISCADFTHPQWFKNLQNNLEEDNNSGLYKLKNSTSKVRFIISTEVSCIYSQGGKTRRVHLCILMPSLASAKKFNKSLADRGAKLASDGRPILGMSAKEILQIMLDTDKRAMMIPAHVWTPWFAVFGSKSGFDNLKECFEELTPHIRAIETGLSSDPIMNWRLSELDNITLVSNSDAHSGPQIGREANVMNLTYNTYDEIIDIIATKDKKRFLYTIEFFPEEGMYHYDGHRECGFVSSPEATKKLKGICPKCKKSLTIGVVSQIEDLSDIAKDKINKSKHIPYKSIVPLPSLIADYFGMGRSSKRVQNLFLDIIGQAGNEFKVLLDLDFSELKKIMPENLAQGIIRMRQNKIKLNPGFDGQYGTIEVFSEEEKQSAKNNKQTALF